MTLNITAHPYGLAATNAYIVADVETKHALIIDAPEGGTDDILAAAAVDGLTIDRIVITHTHWDHIADAAEMQRKSGKPMVAHPLAAPVLAKPDSVTGPTPVEVPPSVPDEHLEEGDVVLLGAHTFVVMHLPGHDRAHIALYSEQDRVFLGGDVLFPNGHGRTDLPGSDQAVMDDSLRRLLDLPGDVVVYPGHGATTTIGRETWMQRLRNE